MDTTQESRSVPTVDLPLLRERYQELNASFTQTRIQQLGTGAGFCAETIGLLKAMASCLDTETSLVIGTHPRGRGFALGHGWEDYFVSPFPTRRGYRYDILNRYRYPAHSRLPQPILSTLHAAARTLLDADLLQFDPPVLGERLKCLALGFHLDWWAGFKLCLDLMWEFRPDVADEVAIHRRAHHMSHPYAAVHIRRGDKRSEAPYVQAELYAKAITSNPSVPRNLAVAADDPAAISVLSRLLGPSYAVTTLSDPRQAGYEQRRFNKLSRDERRSRTIRFLAEFETLKEATILFATLTSNVGCLLRYARANTAIVPVD